MGKNDDIEDDLRKWLSGARKVAIAGVGSSLRKDDFVGMKIVRNLGGKVSKSVYLVECETVPENFFEPIIRFNPTHVLIIDAALLNQKPGSSKLVEPDQVGGHALSTHALPLRIFCEYLGEKSGTKIRLLSIQPKDTGFGEDLTPELESAAKRLSDILVRVLPES